MQELSSNIQISSIRELAFVEETYTFKMQEKLLFYRIMYL